MAIADRQNLVIDRLRHLHEQLGDARNTRRPRANKPDYSGAEIRPARRPAGNARHRRPPEVIELRKQLDAQNAQVAAYALPYGENHPVLRQAKRQRDETETLLTQTAQSAGEGAVHQYEAAKATEQLLQGELTREEQAAVELDRVAIPYHALERDLQSDATLYSQILARLKETDVTQSCSPEHKFSGGFVHLVEKPYAPRIRSGPSGSWSWLAGLFGGATLGGGLAMGRHFLTTRPVRRRGRGVCRVRALAVVPLTKHLGFRRGRIQPPKAARRMTEAVPRCLQDASAALGGDTRRAQQRHVHQPAG